MRDLVIDRSVWLRGEGGNRSRLLRRDDQKMCCVGIYLEACGVPREAIEEVTTAYTVGRVHGLPDEAMWLVDNNFISDSWKFYNVNDEEILFAHDREAALTRLFLGHGVRVTFVDSTPQEATQ